MGIMHLIFFIFANENASDRAIM